MNLSELFREALQYGRVNLFTQDNGKSFSANIKFNTIDHVELITKSGYDGTDTPEKAISLAIAKAKEIVSSLEQTVNTLKQIGA